MSSRLLFIAEEQGRGISPAARGPPGHSLPSPAPTTHHLLRRPQQPLTSSQPHRSPLATRAVWISRSLSPVVGTRPLQVSKLGPPSLVSSQICFGMTRFLPHHLPRKILMR
ncbi:Dual specificity testis-specific protein kinase 2 [Manis javanica]|nr:Dual specificity testis-specific protein kinase 2 [Manis javanica]